MRKEAALGDEVFQIGRRRGDDARINRDGRRTAQPHDVAGLDDVQQRRLQLQRQILDLVQQQCAPLGQLELARLAAGVGVLLMAQYLARHQFVGNGLAVDVDEWPPGSRPVVVDGAGQQVLAYPALATHQHRGQPARRRSRLAHDTAHCAGDGLDVFDAQRRLRAILLLGDLAHVFDGAEQGDVANRQRPGLKDRPQGQHTAHVTPGHRQGQLHVGQLVPLLDRFTHLAGQRQHVGQRPADSGAGVDPEHFAGLGVHLAYLALLVPDDDPFGDRPDDGVDLAEVLISLFQRPVGLQLVAHGPRRGHDQGQRVGCGRLDRADHA